MSTSISAAIIYLTHLTVTVSSVNRFFKIFTSVFPSNPSSDERHLEPLCDCKLIKNPPKSDLIPDGENLMVPKC